MHSYPSLANYLTNLSDIDFLELVRKVRILELARVQELKEKIRNAVKDII